MRYVFKIILAVLLALFSQEECYAQLIDVVKDRCSDSREYKGYRLSIHLVNKDTILCTSLYGYSLGYLEKLPDSTKLLIAKKLLQFEDDTSLACLPVGRYYRDGIENICQGHPKSTRYSIEMDALYMVNKVCYPFAAGFYSCFPVIIDKKSGLEINGSHSMTKEVYKIYKDWLVRCLKNNVIEKDFLAKFNNDRFIWFGGDTIY